jgi:hypothetical protein
MRMEQPRPQWADRACAWANREDARCDYFNRKPGRFPSPTGGTAMRSLCTVAPDRGSGEVAPTTVGRCETCPEIVPRRTSPIAVRHRDRPGCGADSAGRGDRPQHDSGMPRPSAPQCAHRQCRCGRRSDGSPRRALLSRFVRAVAPRVSAGNLPPRRRGNAAATVRRGWRAPFFALSSQRLGI